MNKKRIILDSNVILSAALFKKSVPRQVLDKCFVSGKILMSSATLAEVQELFGRSKKFDKYLSTVSRIEFLNDLIESIEMIEIITEINLCRDPKDNKFLELAINGKADYLISGDQDLLILNPFQEISILSPQAFTLISDL
jgi:putative PIN family toxin of toxin-antitoxin system